MGQGQSRAKAQEGQIDPPPTAKRSRSMVDIIEVSDNHLGQSLLGASLWVQVGWKTFESHVGKSSLPELRDNRAELHPLTPHPSSGLWETHSSDLRPSHQ